MPSRTVLAVAVIVALAGCFGAGPATPTATADDGGAQPAGTGTQTAEPTTEPEFPEVDGAGPWPGRGDSVALTETGTPEDVRYFPSNDTVRYVAAWRHTNHEAVERGEPPEREPVYEYVTAEHWMGFHGPSLGAEAVGDAISSRVGGNASGVSVGQTVENGAGRIAVSRRTVLNRDDEVVFEPTVSIEEVVAVAPRNATVSVRLKDRTFTRTYPVTVRNVTLHQQ